MPMLQKNIGFTLGILAIELRNISCRNLPILAKCIHLDRGAIFSASIVNIRNPYGIANVNNIFLVLFCY